MSYIALNTAATGMTAMSTSLDVTDANAQPAEPASTPPAELDLARVSADLDGVEAALGRLDDGSYWTDEVTGDAIPDDVLAANPVTRRTA